MNELLAKLPPGSAALSTVLLTLLVAMLLSRGMARLIRRLATDGHLSAVMAGRLQLTRRWTVIVVAGLVVLQATGLFDNAWALLSAVLAAVAIGFFAAWSLLSNATSALLILAFRPFRSGDSVELVEPTNRTVLGGKVTDINLMYTTLEETDEETGRVAALHIPNSLFFQKLVRVHTLHEPRTEPFFRESQERVAGADEV